MISKMKIIFSLLLAGTLLLGGCGQSGAGKPGSGAPGTDMTSGTGPESVGTSARSDETARNTGAVSGASDGTDGASEGEELLPEAGISADTVVFKTTDLGGNTVTQDIFGKSGLTMVNVWATYCNPCLREMPGLGEIAAEYDASTFQIIGIVSDVGEGEDQSLAEELVRETGADYSHLLLNKSVYLGLLTDVSAVPTTFFVDENGVILDVVVGSMEKETWEAKINELLAEQ